MNVERKYYNISRLTAEERYIKFISDVVNFESLWIIESSKGVFLLENDERNLIMPLWSEQDLAETYMDKNELSTNKVANIDLDIFLDEWITDAINHKYFYSPLPFIRGMTVSPEKLKSDLEKEMDSYQL